MVDAWDLESHGDTRESSNLSARTKVAPAEVAQW